MLPRQNRSSAAKTRTSARLKASTTKSKARKTKDETDREFEREDKDNRKRDATDTDIEPVPKRKRGRKKKEKFMDDDLLTVAEKADKLRRSDRWIPDIGLRKRVAMKPESVPYELWMSYCMMDEYIYRQSLSDEDVALLPFIDEVFRYKQDGPKPKTPPGFCWDAERDLAPAPL